MIELVPFKRYHFGEFLPSNPRLLDGEFVKRISAIANFDNVFVRTIKNDDITVGVIGGHPIFPGVYEVWSVFSEEIKKSPISLVKTIREALSFQMKEKQIRRYQMFVGGFTKGACRFAEILGFQKEGIIRAFGTNGEDYYLYGKVS